MATFEQIVQIKESVEFQLRGLANVHAVGIGKKKTGGNFTDEIAIVVLVEQKRSRDQLHAKDLVPREINGVKTDVREIKRPRRHAAPTSNLIATRSADNLSVTFSGQEKPGTGLVVQLLFLVTAPDGKTVRRVGYSSTIETSTLSPRVALMGSQLPLLELK